MLLSKKTHPAYGLNLEKRNSRDEAFGG